LRDIFRGRGFGEFDELDDMEEPDSEEETEVEEEVEEEEHHRALDVYPNSQPDVVNKQTKAEEEGNVAAEKDKATDELADMLAKTHIDNA